MIKAVLFDFDDTLISRRHAAYHLYREMLIQNSNLDKDTIYFEAVLQDVITWDQYGNIDKKFVKEKLKEKYSLDLAIDNYNDYWAKNVYRHTKLMDNAMDVLEELRSIYKLGIITNGDSYGQGKKIEASELSSYFQSILISDDVGVQKPNRLIFKKACESLNVNPNEAIYIGDTFSNDIYGAINAGMHAVWIWPHESRLCELCVHRIKELSELPMLLKELSK